MVVAALVIDRVGQARIVEALRNRAAVRFCQAVHELPALAVDQRAAMVITEARDGQGVATAPTIQRLRESFPSVPILAYCSPAKSASQDVLEMARAGVNGLVFRGMDDEGVALRSALSSAEGNAAATRVLRHLDAFLPKAIRPLMVYCLENGASSVTVQSTAATLGVHRRTLVNRLTLAGWPGPSAVISWSRILLAAHFLEDPGRRVEQVALALSFQSGTALRNMLKRYTGLRPQEVRENGGLCCVVRALRRAVDPPLSEEPRR